MILLQICINEHTKVVYIRTYVHSLCSFYRNRVQMDCTYIYTVCMCMPLTFSIWNCCRLSSMSFSTALRCSSCFILLFCAFICSRRSSSANLAIICSKTERVVAVCVHVHTYIYTYACTYRCLCVHGRQCMGDVHTSSGRSESVSGPHNLRVHQMKFTCVMHAEHDVLCVVPVA